MDGRVIIEGMMEKVLCQWIKTVVGKVGNEGGRERRKV